MSYQLRITVDRPAEVVWNYLLTLSNWSQWNGGDSPTHVTPEWKVGACIMWNPRSGSDITRFSPMQELQYENYNNRHCWTFQQLTGDSTMVVYDYQPLNASWVAGSWERQYGTLLIKFKEAVESQTARGGNDEQSSGDGLIHFACPYCHKRLRVKEKAAGKTLRCPNASCAKAIEIPISNEHVLSPALESPVSATSRPTNTTQSRPAAEPIDVDALIAELTRLVATDNAGFTHEARIKAIGEELRRKGGIDLMRQAYYAVRQKGIYFSQIIWHGIGSWQG